MNEVNVDAIDFGGELRQGVELRLDLAPVVICRPVAGEFLYRRELHALRLIGDDFLVRPSSRRDAAFQVCERLVRKMDAEGLDSIGARTALGPLLCSCPYLPGGAPDVRATGSGVNRCVTHDDRSSYEKCDQCPNALHGSFSFRCSWQSSLTIRRCTNRAGGW